MIKTYLGRTLCVLAFLASGVTHAGPFGLEKGMTLAELQSSVDSLERTNSKWIYQSTTVPRPHEDFEQYGFYVTPSNGLCVVRAISKTVQDDGWGLKLRTRLLFLATDLEAIYGHASYGVDYLRPNSAWSDSSEWLVALAKKDRIFNLMWRMRDGMNLKDGISEIVIEAKGLNRSSGYISLTYTFDNIDACQREGEQSNKQAF